MKTQEKIRTTKGWSVYKSDWGKVEKLPILRTGNGWEDREDNGGVIYRVTFRTFMEGKKVNRQV